MIDPLIWGVFFYQNYKNRLKIPDIRLKLLVYYNIIDLNVYLILSTKIKSFILLQLGNCFIY